MILGALLWIGRAVKNKLYVALSAIGSQQAAATEDTMAAVNQLLDYCVTYPGDGTTSGLGVVRLCFWAWVAGSNLVCVPSVLANYLPGGGPGGLPSSSVCY